MRTFANLFLILFVADGGFSLVDELVTLLTPLTPFTSLRNFLAETVILMSIPLYVCLGIDRRLPKRVFLPLISFVFFCTLSIGLFPVLGKVPTYGLLVSLTQVVLGMLPLYWFRTDGERSLTMPPEMFAAPWFSFRNTLAFGAASIFIIPCAVALVAFAAANASMETYTSGFMRLDPGGLRMTERVYRRENRTIRLAAMIHVGDREYYDELSRSIAGGRTIVLAEGVSDKKKLLADRIDYGRMAGFLGLSSQHEMRLKGRLIEAEEIESAPVRDVGKNIPPAGEAAVFRADVDVSEFRPPTLLFLNALAKHLRESPSFVQGVLALNSWGEKNITPEMYEIIMDDILHRRNMKVVHHLEKALAGYETVVIPWGALHMKEIEEEVLKRGFTLQEERERLSIDFRRIFMGML